MQEKNKKHKHKKKKMNLRLAIIVILIIAVIMLVGGKEKNKAEISLNSSEGTEQVLEEKNEEQDVKEAQKENDITNNAPIEKNVELKEGKTNTKGLPVLMYHFFYDASAGQTGKDNNYMEISSFEEQMKYLSENNYYFPTWDEVVDYVDGKIKLPEKSVVLTADDGDNSFFWLAVPVIEKYNVRMTSFIVTTWTDENTVNQFKSNKIDFQSHSNNMHSAGANGKGKFVNYTYEQGMEDVETSAKITGTKDAFCYPFGHYNDTSKKVLKDAGYKLAFTTKGGRVKPGQDKYELPRVRMSKGISLKSFISSVS